MKREDKQDTNVFLCPDRWDDYTGGRLIIGIDPGASGGITVWSVDDDCIVAVQPMPPAPEGVLEMLTRWGTHATAYLERVGGIPGQGGAASMFTFGRGFGHLEMALLALRIPTVEVTPQRWQKELQCGTRGSRTADQWKMSLVARAQQLFPRVGGMFGLRTKRDWLSVSDALLITAYGRIMEGRGAAL